MVGIVILNYNNASDTINCIQSVEKYNTFPIKYAIVDNGSTDNSVSQLTEELKILFKEKFAIHSNNHKAAILPYCTLTETGENLGYARGNNVGLQLFENDTEIDTLMVLNNDILFIEDIIPSLYQFLTTHHDCAIVSPLLYKKDQQTIDYNCARLNCSNKKIWFNYIFQRHNVWGVLSKDVERQKILLHHPEFLNYDSFEIELPSGSCMLIKKELFKQIDYFDPHTFLYYEENILFKKIERLGLKNYLIPKLHCVHLGASTMKKTKFSEFQIRQRSSSAFHYARLYSGIPRVTIPLLWCFYKLTTLRIYISSYINKQ